MPLFDKTAATTESLHIYFSSCFRLAVAFYVFFLHLFLGAFKGKCQRLLPRFVTVKWKLGAIAFLGRLKALPVGGWQDV